MKGCLPLCKSPIHTHYKASNSTQTKLSKNQQSTEEEQLITMGLVEAMVGGGVFQWEVEQVLLEAWAATVYVQMKINIVFISQLQSMVVDLKWSQ